MVWTALFWLRIGHMVVCCEDNNEPLAFIKVGSFLTCQASQEGLCYIDLVYDIVYALVCTDIY
jgi:hypothetical protein